MVYMMQTAGTHRPIPQGTRVDLFTTAGMFEPGVVVVAFPDEVLVKLDRGGVFPTLVGSPVLKIAGDE